MRTALKVRELRRLAELRLGPGTPAWDGPAGIGDARVVASLLLVHPDLGREDAVGTDVFALDGPAALAVAVGRDVPTALARLDAATHRLGRVASETAALG